MTLSAAQAAAAVGMTKAGIIRAIHSGKLSATRNEHGNFVVDPAELFRVYDAVSTDVKSARQIDENLTNDPHTSLQEKVALLERIINDKDDVIADLRTRLDVATDEWRRLGLLLVDHQSQPRSWWARVFGGGE